MSTLKTNNIEHLDASSPSIQLGIGGGINVSGVVTATSFVGNITGNINSSGISTLSNVVVGGATTELVVTGDARITGILTVGTASVTLNGTDGTITGINTINGLTYPSAGPLSNRNLIINGAMQVAQRGTSQSSVSDGSDEGYQTLDRFALFFANSAGGVCTVSQDSTVPSNVGLSSSYKVDVTTADTSVDSTHMIYVTHKIEAQNVRNSGWNYTSSSSYLTVSFWVRSSKAGTYCLTIRANDVGAKYYVIEYTLAADTWTKVTHSIPGDSSLVFDNDNGVGMEVRWVLVAGASRNDAVAEIWEDDSVNNAATSNQLNFFDSTSNDFYLTGVQLEVGERVTPFEHRSYGDELARCQRYYYKLTADSGRTFANGYNQNTRHTRNILHFPVSMRIPPTALEQTGTAANYRIYHGTTENACSGVPTLNSSTTNTAEIQADTGSGLTAGQGNALESNSNGTYLAFTAEL